MQSVKLIYLLSILMMCSCQFALAQRDSLTVFVKGYGFKGEKYRIYNHNREVLKFTSNGRYIHSFSIPIGLDWKYGTPLPVYIERKGKFRFWYRSIGLNAIFETKKTYFILYRDPRLKNRVALDYVWSNSVPGFAD